MSTTTSPAPSQASQRPPGTLNENQPGGEAQRGAPRASRRSGGGSRRRPSTPSPGSSASCARAGPARPPPPRRARRRPRCGRTRPRSGSRRRWPTSTEPTSDDLPAPETPETTTSWRERNLDRDVLQVVRARADDAQRRLPRPRRPRAQPELAAQRAPGRATPDARAAPPRCPRTPAARRRRPPRGPRSITWSAAATISGACSTTTTVLPWSRIRSSTRTSRRESRGCRPIEGSSST